MELLTQKQVYDEVEATSLCTNEIITKIEAQSITSQKLKRITNDISGYSDDELIDQFQCESITKDSYTIQISYDNQNWSDTAQLLFAAKDHSDAGSKRVYVKAIKHTCLISGEEISQEPAEYSIDLSEAKSLFKCSSNTDGYSLWPVKENTSDSVLSKKCTISIINDASQTCQINLIQLQAGSELVYGDVVDFTYQWTDGRDLDQATRIDCFIDGVQGQYVGFGTNSRIALSGVNILGFAGDNTGTGQEHALVDFDALSKYIKTNGGDQSTIDGVTIKDAITDINGLLSVKVYLYTVWFSTKGSNIQIACTMYKKDGDDFTFSNGDNHTFNISGATLSGSTSLSAYCKTDGYTHGAYKDPESNMTLSAVFTYYFNSGAFSIKTNYKGDL